MVKDWLIIAAWLIMKSNQVIKFKLKESKLISIKLESECITKALSPESTQLQIYELNDLSIYAKLFYFHMLEWLNSI